MNGKAKEKIEEETTAEENTFSVNVFLGKDKVIRLVPGAKSSLAPYYVPLPAGLEVPYDAGPEKIGNAYLKAAGTALAHFGEKLDMRTAKPKYVSFKGFKSQKQFDLQHFCFSSFCIGGKIKFTFLPWHKKGFCLFKEDIKCVVEIEAANNELIIGNAILEVMKKADEAYPEMHILSKNLDRIDIDNILHKDSIKKEIANRKVQVNEKDYQLADEMREELFNELGVESNYLSDLTYKTIKDDRCIPILAKYIPLFENAGIGFALVQQQFWRKNNKECSDFLQEWYCQLKKDNALTRAGENVLDNAFSRIGGRDKIPFYIELIKQADSFPLVMVMLARWRVKEAKQIIIERLEKDTVKTLAIRALGYYKDKQMILLIEKYFDSESAGVRKEAEKVINRLKSL